jgi:proteasome lid subunit RPN8/RPN11
LSERPKIVAERKRRAREMKPPQDFMIHEWGKPYAGIEVYISQNAFDKMMKQCAIFAKRHLEAMGYLVGDYCRWKNKEYTIIEDAVTSDLETTSVSVHFQAFEKAFDQLDKIDFDYVIVGWYHSHPGHGCFMSQTDISTQKRMFNKPFHSAIVVDPINKEFKVYKMMGNMPEEKVFAIYKDLDSEGPPVPLLIGGTEGQSPYEAAGTDPGPEPVTEGRPGGDGPATGPSPDVPKKLLRDHSADRRLVATSLLFMLPIFFAAFGGVAGFVLSLHRDRRVAWVILAVGGLMTMIWLMIGPMIRG